MAYLLRRNEAGTSLYDLDDEGAQDRLRAHMSGEHQSGIDHGDAWVVAEEGDPIPLVILAKIGDFTEPDDYAVREVRFTIPDVAEPVATISHLVDGRS